MTINYDAITGEYTSVATTSIGAGIQNQTDVPLMLSLDGTTDLIELKSGQFISLTYTSLYVRTSYRSATKGSLQIGDFS